MSRQLRSLFIAGLYLLLLCSQPSAAGPRVSAASSAASPQGLTAAEQGSFRASTLTARRHAQNAEKAHRRDSLRIFVFGNSITAGYGIPTAASFPVRIQRKIEKKGWPAQVTFAGKNGQTTREGRQRIQEWPMSSTDILVLELGGNDGLQEVPPPNTRRNLRSITEAAQSENPALWVLLVGVQVPTAIRGPEARRQYQKVYPPIDEAYKRVELVSLVPEQIENAGALMQPDGIHPNEKGHKVIADRLWQKLSPLIGLMIGEASGP